MAPKKQKNSKLEKLKEKTSKQDEMKEQPDDCIVDSTAHCLEETNEVQDLEPFNSGSVKQDTVTTTESVKLKSGGKRSICAMHKVVKKKAQGKKYKVRYNECGNPIGSTRAILQSYIGMLARNMIPIDIPSWPNVSSDLKNKIWEDVQETFKIKARCEDYVLKSAGIKWRQFKADLTRKFVLPFLGQKKKLAKPPKDYHYVGKNPWRNFIAERSNESWKELHTKQSEKVRKRKYHHRLSRKGYIGLKEEEIKKGNLAKGEEPDRAIFWKKAHYPKDDVVDEEFEKINKKIDTLLEKKSNGEFRPSGAEDVLTVALETPEHSCRVRVEGFITPKAYFKMPRQKKKKGVTVSEFERRTQELMNEISQLKELVKEQATHLSPISDKASCRVETDEPKKNEPMLKPEAAKVLTLEEDDDDCVFVDHPPPTLNNKMSRSCELAVDIIDNKVAFGFTFPSFDDMPNLIHGRPLEAGCIRVSVDGAIKPNAMLPCPVIGELEYVHEAVGSHVAWPEYLISYPSVIKKKKNLANKDDFRKAQEVFKEIQLRDKVPKRFRLMYKHVSSIMKATGTSIQIPCDKIVYGVEKTVFVLQDDIMSLLEFNMIGQAIISAYMLYLHTKIREIPEGLETFAFFDPALTHCITTEFEQMVVSRLKEGNADRMFFLPHNQNLHWILSIIWEGEIYILNSLPHPNHFPALEKSLTSAVKSFNAQTGRGAKVPKVKHLPGSPKQPGGTECGYAIMRYMKDIIEDTDFSLLKKWSNKLRNTFSEKQLDEVRHEALGYLEEHM